MLYIYSCLIQISFIAIGELEVLLEASIRLSKAGIDRKYEPCQRFYREGLLTSFTKVNLTTFLFGSIMQLGNYIIKRPKYLNPTLSPHILQ